MSVSPFLPRSVRDVLARGAPHDVALRVLVAPSETASPLHAEWLAASAAAHPSSITVAVAAKPVDQAALAALLAFDGDTQLQQQGELRVVVAGVPSRAREDVLQLLLKLGHPGHAVAVVP
jgi:hypothetical protein